MHFIVLRDFKDVKCRFIDKTLPYKKKTRDLTKSRDKRQFITKTCPCNILRFFTAVKMTIFSWNVLTIFIFLLKTYIVGTR